MKNGAVLDQKDIYEGPAAVVAVDVEGVDMILATNGVSEYPGQWEAAPAKVSRAPLASPENLVTIVSEDTEYATFNFCIFHGQGIIAVACAFWDGLCKLYNLSGSYLYSIYSSDFNTDCQLIAADISDTDIETFLA
jgi:hypothetical protein